MKKKREVMIGEKINENLGLRSSARVFFDELNDTPEDEVIINFKNVEFISRSFAHEYVQQKNKTAKRIIEINIPNDVMGMFKVVSGNS